MDIQMPEMNGLEAAAAIRALGRSDAKTIPIIAMTANTFKEDVEAAMAAGMTSLFQNRWMWRLCIMSFMLLFIKILTKHERLADRPGSFRTESASHLGGSKSEF